MSIVEVESSEDGLRTLRSALCCAHCGGLLIPCDTGAVCEKWECGGVQWAGQADLFAQQFWAAKRLSDWLALPIATAVLAGRNSYYLLSGLEGKYRRLDHASSSSVRARKKPCESNPRPTGHFQLIVATP